jgi:DNA-binding response OmpR family regulator
MPPTMLDILVVDDDENIRRIVSCILRQARHRVACAADGEDAWTAMSATHYDVLITDNDMPRLTGVDLLRRVRALPSRLPVMMITGRITWEEAEVAPLLYPGLVLEKPFSSGDLLAALRRVMAVGGGTASGGSIGTPLGSRRE